jgi:hypothetical protein
VLLRSAAGIRSDGAALYLLNRDGAIDPVNFGNRSRSHRSTSEIEARGPCSNMPQEFRAP